MKQIIGSLSLSAFVLLITFSKAAVAEAYTLRAYAEALRMNDVQKIENFRSYVLGAVETHFMYSKMLRDYTSINILCAGNKPINKHELGSIFELQLFHLRERYGEDVMGMPLVNAVQMIIEDRYRCY